MLFSKEYCKHCTKSFIFHRYFLFDEWLLFWCFFRLFSYFRFSFNIWLFHDCKSFPFDLIIFIIFIVYIFVSLCCCLLYLNFLWYFFIAYKNPGSSCQLTLFFTICITQSSSNVDEENFSHFLFFLCVSVMDTIVLHVDRTINKRKRLGFTKNQMGGKIVCILNSVSITFIIIAVFLPFCKFSAKPKNNTITLLYFFKSHLNSLRCFCFHIIFFCQSFGNFVKHTNTCDVI